MSPLQFAELLQKCAEAMNAEDARRIAAGERHWKSVAGDYTVEGRNICAEVVRKDTSSPVQHEEPWAEIAYLLLAGAWNDVLDWCERVKS